MTATSGVERAPALVILAAGASRRLGTCKALVALTPETPLALLVRAGACLDGDAPLVIAGADHAAIAAAAPRAAEVAFNAAWPTGRTSTVALAQRLRAGRDLCLAPVDVPLVPARVFAGLRDAWLAAGSPPRGWLAPRLAPPLADRRGGRSDAPAGLFGHPVVVGRELALSLAARDPRDPLSRLRAAADPLWSIEVDAPEILDDLDTPEDLARLRARLGA